MGDDMNAPVRRVALTVVMAMASAALAAAPAAAAPDSVSWINKTADGARPGGFVLPTPYERPAISKDGRLVAFSTTQRLDPADTNGYSDIYLYDAATDSTRWVSARADGAAAGADSWDASVSGDGRFLAFSTEAHDLVEGTLGTCMEVVGSCSDVVLRDLSTGAMTLVSTDAGPTGSATEPAVSADGRYVAYLVYPDVAVSQVVRWDRLTGERVTASVDGDGSPGSKWAERPHISSDGRFIAFGTMSVLDPADQDDHHDIYLRDMGSGTTRLISHPYPGEITEVAPIVTGLTDAGAVLYAHSTASCDIYGWCEAWGDVWLATAGGSRERMNLTEDGSIDRGRRWGSNADDEAHISSDGRFVIWSTQLAISAEGPGLYRRDRGTGELRRVSWGGYAQVSADGSGVTFASSRSYAGSPDGQHNLFLARFGSGTTAVQADISVRWSDVAAAVPVRQPTQGAVLVSNAGPATATDVRIEVALDSSAALSSYELSAGSGSCTSARGRVECTVTSLAPEAVAEVRLSFSYKRAGTATHAAAASATEPDPASDNDTATVSATVTK